MDPNYLIYSKYNLVTTPLMLLGYTVVIDQSERLNLSLPDQSTNPFHPPLLPSATPSRPSQPILKTRKAPQKTPARTRTHLTDKDHLVILYFYNRDSNKYGWVTNKRFQKEIVCEFKETTSKEYDLLQQVVDSIVKKRRQFLKDLKSETQDLTDEKTIQTDTWISTLNAYKAQEDADEEE